MMRVLQEEHRVSDLFILYVVFRQHRHRTGLGRSTLYC